MTWRRVQTSKKGSPVYSLQERLIRWQTGVARGKPLPKRATYAAALIRTWNAYVRNEQLYQISGHVKPGAKFPQIISVGKGSWKKNSQFKGGGIVPAREEADALRRAAARVPGVGSVDSHLAVVTPRMHML